MKTKIIKHSIKSAIQYGIDGHYNLFEWVKDTYLLSMFIIAILFNIKDDSGNTDYWNGPWYTEEINTTASEDYSEDIEYLSHPWLPIYTVI